MAGRALAAASYAAEEEELQAALKKARVDYESAMNAAAEAEARVANRVAALEAGEDIHSVVFFFPFSSCFAQIVLHGDTRVIITVMRWCLRGTKQKT